MKSVFPKRTHGMSGTPIYLVWIDMVRRCTKPNHHAFRLYGGRGITVCNRWLAFENFFADMGDRPSPEHSIDRKENDKGYSPNNCRWATSIEQSNNRSTNRFVTYEGKTQTVTEWAREKGFWKSTLRYRLNHGVPIDQLFKPVRGAKA